MKHRVIFQGAMTALLSATILSVTADAQARRRLLPEKPSVELNLDVLRQLAERPPRVAPVYNPDRGYPAAAPNRDQLPFQVGSSRAVRHYREPATNVPSTRHVPPTPPVANPATALPPPPPPPPAVQAEIPQRMQPAPWQQATAPQATAVPQPDNQARRRPILNPQSGAAPTMAPQPYAPAISPHPQMQEREEFARFQPISPEERSAATKRQAARPAEEAAPPPVPRRKPMKAARAEEPDRIAAPPMPEPEPMAEPVIQPEPITEPAPAPFAAIEEPEPLMPSMPDVNMEPVDLPEPDIDNINFDDFPELAPLPEPGSAEADMLPEAMPETDMPFDDEMEPVAPMTPLMEEPVPEANEPMPEANEPMPEINEPMPEAMPSLTRNFDSLIASNSPDAAPELPSGDPVQAMPELPEMPAMPLQASDAPFPDLPDPALLTGEPTEPAPQKAPPVSAMPQPPQPLPELGALTGDEAASVPTAPPIPLPQEMPAAMTEQPVAPPPPSELPDMPDFDTVPQPIVNEDQPAMPKPAELASLPPENIGSAGMPSAPKPSVSLPGSTSITFAETENELPVMAQKTLNNLAEGLKEAGGKITIRPFVDASNEPSTQANAIATRRAFTIRSYLIDKGVSHFNISIDRSPGKGPETPERVDLFIQQTRGS